MDVEQERLRLASDAAALRFMRALAKRELKYREDQAREPATGRGGRGGKFVDEGRGKGGGKAPAFLAPAAAAVRAGAAAAVEAGVLAGAGSAASLTGVMGAAMVGLAGDSRQPRPRAPQSFRKIDAPPPEPPPRGRYEEECDEQYEKDIVDCQAGAAMYARGPKSKKQIFAICRHVAEIRRAECLQGGLSQTRTPPYLSNHHFSPEPKR